jgi:hypothetical protein
MKSGQFIKPDIHVEAWTVYQASYNFFLIFTLDNMVKVSHNIPV